MNCEEYRKKYPDFMKMPLAREIWESQEYEDWQEHGFECPECSLWDLEQQVVARGKSVADFPCVHIAYHSTVPCDDHDDPWECPDIVIVKTTEGFGIPIRDGGSSYIEIYYCPWCGVSL